LQKYCQVFKSTVISY